MTNIKTLFALTVVGSLLGCGEEIAPGASASNCSAKGMEAALAEIRSEAQRQSFEDECKAFQKAQRMRQWDFKPSPPDDF